MSVWSMELVSAPQASDPKRLFRTRWGSMIAKTCSLSFDKNESALHNYCTVVLHGLQDRYRKMKFNH